jgi:Pectate lyase superfamily protein
MLRSLQYLFTVSIALVLLEPAIFISTLSQPPKSLVITVSIDGSTIQAVDNSGNVIATGNDAATVIQESVNKIKASPEGGTIHVDQGTYLISKPLDLSGANNIILEGASRDGTILRASTSGIHMLDQRGNTSNFDRNITIQKLTLDGAGISDKLLDMGYLENLDLLDCVLEGHHEVGGGPGVIMRSIRDGLIQHCISRNHSGTGGDLSINGWNIRVLNNEVYRGNGIHGAGGAIASAGIVSGEIAYNYIHDGDWNGAITLENQARGSKNLRVHDNRIENLAGAAINMNNYALDGSHQPHDNIEIDNNIITNVSSFGIRLGAYTLDDGCNYPQGITPPDCRKNELYTNFKIHNNTIRNTDLAIFAGPLQNSDIYNNDIGQASGALIRLFSNSTQDNDVTDNVRVYNNSHVETSEVEYEGSGKIYIGEGQSA